MTEFEGIYNDYFRDVYLYIKSLSKDEQVDDVLIYGKSLVGSGGVLTLPRLFLAAYLRIALLLYFVLVLSMNFYKSFKHKQR